MRIQHGMKMNEIYNILIENLELKRCLYETKNRIAEVTHDMKDYSATDHGIAHINRVVDYLLGLYNNYFSFDLKLNEYEAFVLLVAAYLHDIGFYLQDEVVLKRFCRWAKIDFPEKNRGTFYRKRHPQISAFWIWCNITNNINLPQIYYGDKSLAYSVMKIVMSHGMDFWKDPQYFYKMQVNGNIINEIYLSYLLCLGDTLDCDKRRIANINNIESVKIEDKIYLRRHYYIEKVLLEKNNIKIVINIPNVKSKNIKLFNYFYIEKATEWIYYWEKMCSELFANNLKFPSIDLCILQNSKISEPTQIEYNYIKQIINEQYGKIYNK